VGKNLHKSLSQLARYALVGGFNSGFSFGVYALLTWSFRGLGSYSYMYAAVISNFLAISAAFLGYKWFVFRTKGNYLREWIRCFAVYGGSSLLGLIGLPIVVTILRHVLQKPGQAPYVGAAIVMMIGVISSFFGHRNFSFRQTTADDDPPGNSGPISN
jgi:putative flippase GtrA